MGHLGNTAQYMLRTSTTIIKPLRFLLRSRNQTHESFVCWFCDEFDGFEDREGAVGGALQGRHAPQLRLRHLRRRRRLRRRKGGGLWSPQALGDEQCWGNAS